MILGLIAGAVWFVLFLLGHGIILRTLSAAAKPRANQLLFFIGLAGIAVSLRPLIASAQDPMLMQGGFVLGAFCGVIVYAGLFVLYMPFYYVVAASLSVATIVLLNQKPDGALPLAVLQDTFASRRLVAQRLETLVENGFLQTVPAGYGLTTKGRRVARFFDCLKLIWKLGPGG
jgi:hypothetical protein